MMKAHPHRRRARRSRPTMAFTFKKAIIPTALRMLNAWRFARNTKHLFNREHQVGRDLRARRNT
jgi:hypothetical protein